MPRDIYYFDKLEIEEGFEEYLEYDIIALLSKARLRRRAPLMSAFEDLKIKKIKDLLKYNHRHFLDRKNFARTLLIELYTVLKKMKLKCSKVKKKRKISI